jgi:hypothetical protein
MNRPAGLSMLTESMPTSDLPPLEREAWESDLTYRAHLTWTASPPLLTFDYFRRLGVFDEHELSGRWGVARHSGIELFIHRLVLASRLLSFCSLSLSQYALKALN